jgi:hypothetical protein
MWQKTDFYLMKQLFIAEPTPNNSLPWSLLGLLNKMNK